VLHRRGTWHSAVAQVVCLGVVLTVLLCGCGKRESVTGAASPWHRLPGTFATRGRSISMTFSDADHGWLVGELGNGVLETRDGARTWKPCQGRIVGAPWTGVGALPAQPAQLANTMQVLTVDGSVFVAYDGSSQNGRQKPGLRAGVLVSRDRGHTWRRCLALPGARASVITLAASDADHVWALYGVGDWGATDHRYLLASKDSGRTWRRVWQGDYSENSAEPFLDAPLQFVDPVHGWDSGDSGPVTTSDAGVTWASERSPGDSFSFALDAARAWDAWGSSGENLVTVGGLASTSDGGGTWKDVKQFRGMDMSGEDDLYFADSMHGWVIGPGVGNRLAIWATSDGGRSWHSELDWRPGPGYWVFARAGDKLILAGEMEMYFRELPPSMR
jgi:photosystem II stability/assembly factor-like uncharacterized protein